MSRISRATFIIAFFFGVDKILGLVRQVLFSRQFGNDLDIFNASNNIPDLLSALISGGALGIALIPVLSEYLERDGRKAAWNLFTRILNLAFIATAFVALAVILLADPLIRHVIVPGFTPERQTQTIALMRLDLVAILIFSISGLVMAGLQTNQHFVLPAMAPAFYNFGQIFGVLVLAPSKGFQLGPVTLPAFGLGLRGLVYGVILGACLHLAIQIPGLIRYQYRWAPKIDLHDPGVIRILKLMAPRVATMFCLQLYFVTRDRLASYHGEGSVTVLNLGWFIQQVPETLIGTAIAIAVLPSISELLARGDRVAFGQTVNRALRVMLALTLPVAAVLIVGVRPLVEVFGSAEKSVNLDLLAWAARVFLLGLLGHAWLEVAVRSFYAQQDARTPFFAAAAHIVTYMLLATLLSALLQTTGLALADTLTFSGEALVLLYILNRRFPGALQVRDTLLRAGLAALGAAVVALLVVRFVPIPAMFRALLAMALGGLAILPLIWREVKLVVHL